MCLCFGCGGVCSVGGECVGGLRPWSGRVGGPGWGDVMSVCVVSLDSLCR